MSLRGPKNRARSLAEENQNLRVELTLLKQQEKR